MKPRDQYEQLLNSQHWLSANIQAAEEELDELEEELADLDERIEKFEEDHPEYKEWNLNADATETENRTGHQVSRTDRDPRRN